MDMNYGKGLREEMRKGEIIPFIGVYDVFSASIAANYYDGIFVSGFSFAASHYGLPDIGFIAWSDIVAFVQRVRTLLPSHHILVDIDDGYADVEVACHVVSILESVGASGVIIEDQLRPKRCGHLDGKQLMDLDQFLLKLRRVLETRRDMIVIARTDASDIEEISRRAEAFAEAGADAILIDGLKDLGVISRLKHRINRPFTFNQIAGGKSPNFTLRELSDAGVSLVNYSTPCLFAAQGAIENVMRSLRENDGLLPQVGQSPVGLPECALLLQDNLARRRSVDRESFLSDVQVDPLPHRVALAAIGKTIHDEPYRF